MVLWLYNEKINKKKNIFLNITSDCCEGEAMPIESYELLPSKILRLKYIASNIKFIDIYIIILNHIFSF